jgi:phosphatidylinositol kinase/protein kinase (PI-3  family)
MGVLRANKDSLLAVLEAFVHDPLLNWNERMDTEGSEDHDIDSRPIAVVNSGIYRKP